MPKEPIHCCDTCKIFFRKQGSPTTCDPCLIDKQNKMSLSINTKLIKCTCSVCDAVFYKTKKAQIFDKCVNCVDYFRAHGKYQDKYQKGN